jgi:hypothetical protein
MSIETLTDWNERLGYCGCCEMPECPAPVGVAEQKTASVCGFRFPFYHPSITLADKARFFREINEADRQTDNRTDTSVRFFEPTLVVTDAFDNREQIKKRSKVGGVCTEVTFSRHRLAESERVETQDDWIFTTTYDGEYHWQEGVLLTQTGATTYTGTDYPEPVVEPNALLWQTYNFSAVINNSWVYEPLAVRFIDVLLDEDGEIAGGSYRYRTIEYLNEITIEEIDDEVAAMDWSVTTFTGVSARRFNGSAPSTNIYRIIRFRFRIPTSHTGSKFYITYDIAEFPEDGDPSFVSEDNVVEWTGPGTGSSSDPSWLTPWVEIDPPEVPGERRVVNIRYTCYSGTKYGSKPQVIGEAFTPITP